MPKRFIEMTDKERSRFCAHLTNVVDRETHGTDLMYVVILGSEHQGFLGALSCDCIDLKDLPNLLDSVSSELRGEDRDLKYERMPRPEDN